MTSFFDVVTSQRACRSFSDRAVTDDEIAQVLTAATHAPSAENKQPWEFVVVRDAARRAAIGVARIGRRRERRPVLTPGQGGAEPLPRRRVIRPGPMQSHGWWSKHASITILTYGLS